MVVPDWPGTVTLQVLFALCCECLPAFRMLARRHEAMLPASGTSPWRGHTLGVSVCKCRSCCRRELQALSFAAVCAAAKGGRMCFSTFSQPWWSEREAFLISKSDLHDSSLCNAFYSSLTAFFLPLFGSWGGLFHQLFFLLIDLIPLWPQHFVGYGHVVYLALPSNSNIWINFDHQIHSCCLWQGSAQCQKVLSPVFKQVAKIDHTQNWPKSVQCCLSEK